MVLDFGSHISVRDADVRGLVSQAFHSKGMEGKETVDKAKGRNTETGSIPDNGRAARIGNF